MLVFKKILSELITRTRKQSPSPKLEPSQQKAIIAYFILDYIRNFQPQAYKVDSRSIREKMLDRKYFNAYVLKQLNQSSISTLGIKQNPTQEWLNQQLEEINFNQVTKAFVVKFGAQFNDFIWQQNRFKDATISYNRTVLSPTLVTKMYFDQLFPPQTSILSGAKGIGKSFSFLIYDHFSTLVNLQKINNKQFMSVQNQFIPLQKLQNSQKICYINLRQKKIFSEYHEQLIIQFNELYPIQQAQTKYSIQGCSQKEIQKIICEFLKQVQKRYLKKGIAIVGIIDQANTIFRLFRELQKKYNEQKIDLQNQHERDIEAGIPPSSQKKTPKKWKQCKQYKDLVFYGQIFKLFTDNMASMFSRIILNSSQDFEIQYIKKLEDQIRKSLYIVTFLQKLRQIDKSNIRNMKYSRQIFEQVGQMESYNCLWLQILRFMEKYKVTNTYQDQVKFSRQKAIFFKAFQKDNKLQIWKNDVKRYEMRQYIQELKDSKTYNFLYDHPNNIFIKQQFSSNDEQAFIKNLRRLKQNIQNYRIGIMVQSITQYYKKITNNQQSKTKQMFIKCIYDEANQKLADGEDQPFYKYKAISIPPIDRYAFIASMGFGYNYIHRNESQDQKQINSKQKQSPQQIEKQLSVPIQQENQEQILDYLIFTTSPRTMIEIIEKSQLSIEYSILDFRHISLLIQDPSSYDRNQFYGRMLDKLAYHYLSTPLAYISIRQYFYLDKTIAGFSPIINKASRYCVSQSAPFRGFTKIVNSYTEISKKQDLLDPLDNQVHEILPITNTDLERQFSRLVFLTKQLHKRNNPYYLGCYPVIYDSKYQINSLCLNQRTFDSMLLRLRNPTTLQVILIDWTMGRITAKKKNYLKQIKYLMGLIPFEGNIQCKLMIVAPEYNVNTYLKQLKQGKKQMFCSYFKSEKATDIDDLDQLAPKRQKFSNIQTKARVKPQNIEISIGFSSFNRQIIFSLYQNSDDHNIITKIVQNIYDSEQKKALRMPQNQS